MKNYIKLYKQSGDEKYLKAYYENEGYQDIYKKIKPKWKEKFRIITQVMKLEDGDRVLDIGCASKILKPYIEQKGAIYKGLDIASGFQPDYVSNAETLEGVSDNSFDWAVVSDLLEHVHNPSAVLHSARRVSNQVLAVVPNWYRLERFGSLLPRNPNDRHLHKLPPKKWLKLFEEAGLSVSYVQGFFYVPSIAFYPFRILNVIDRVFRFAPFRLISKPIDNYFSDWPIIRFLGQELIIIGNPNRK